MKKFLLSLCLTMLACVGVWAQATHTSYKFKVASDGTLFMDAEGNTPAEYSVDDVCSGTYYLKVDYQHTDAPATKNGPSTFDVKTYYVDGVCTYGQEYDEVKNYTKVDPSTFTEITNDNKEGYVTSALFWTAGAVNAGVHKSDLSGEYPADSGEPILEGGVCDPNGHYWVNGGDQLGSTVAEYQNWSMSGMKYAIESTAFKDEFANNIYTLVDGKYVKVTSNVYVSTQTYYYVTFTPAEKSEVEDASNFTASKLVDLSADSRTLFHKNGTSYVAVNDGDLFVEDDAYYVAGTSYQPCTPAELAALGYATGTTTTYNCSVVESADKKTITITRNENWTYATMEAYLAVASDVLSNHENVVIEDATNTIGNSTTFNGLIPAFNNLHNVPNVVLSNCLTNGTFKYDMSELNNSEIKRIILPSANRTSFIEITNSTNSPVILQVVNTTTNQVLIQSPVAGSLAAIKDYHYYSDEINAATRQVYFGEINGADVEWFDGINVAQLDMTGITYGGDASKLEGIKAALHNLTNSNLVYIALPDLGSLPAEPLYKDLRSNCPNVKAVGQYWAEKNSLNYYGVEPGGAATIMDMLKDLSGSDSAPADNIKNLKMSGFLNFKDIYGNYDGAAYNDVTGNFCATDAEGATKTGGALVGADVVNADFGDAVFGHMVGDVFEEHAEDMTFSKSGTVFALQMETLILPRKLQTTIPKECLYNCQKLKELGISSNYKNIETKAFYLMGNQSAEKAPKMRIFAVNVDGDGTVLETIDNGYLTVTLPSSLEKIETLAFHMTWHPTDVFSLATTAPKCEQDAFDGPAYVGNNGFAGEQHPISRPNYYNGATSPIAILHYPAELIDQDGEKYYTDVTRKYDLKDETNVTNDRGELLSWPTQVNFGQAYNSVINGYLFDEIDYAGSWGEITPKVGTTPKGNEDFHEDYVGWYQFVLTGNTTSTETNWNFNYDKDRWYTICVPFSLKASEVKEIFGDETKVCKLVSVSRQWTTQDRVGQIFLNFGGNILESAADESTVIYKTYSYLIKPSKNTTEGANAGKYAVDLTGNNETNYLPAYNNGTEAGTFTHKSTHDNALNNTKVTELDYSFIGNFEARDKFVPENAYFLGYSPSAKTSKFYRCTAPNKYKWPAYTAIIGIVQSKEELEHKDANQHIIDQLEINYTLTNDRFEESEMANPVAGAKITTLEGMVEDYEGEMGTPNVIVNIAGEDMNSSEIYNINGQRVNGNVKNLGKGLYIVNGKKMIVK